MRAIDTNVVARYLLGDDPRQALTAQRIIEDEIFVPVTVLLELSWLLRSRYGFPREAVAALLGNFLDLSTVTVADPSLVRWALDRYACRGDFADLLHVIGSGPAARFSTFDAGVVSAAGPDAPVPVETLS